MVKNVIKATLKALIVNGIMKLASKIFFEFSWFFIGYIFEKINTIVSEKIICSNPLQPGNMFAPVESINNLLLMRIGVNPILVSDNQDKKEVILVKIGLKNKNINDLKSVNNEKNKISEFLKNSFFLRNIENIKKVIRNGKKW